MTAKEKMLAGELYLATDAELTAERLRARRITDRLNRLSADDGDEAAVLIAGLFGAAGEGTVVTPPFRCDYGYNIRIGRNGFLNYDCVFLDVMPITIGDHAQIAPGVHVYTATHPVDAERRRSGAEYGKEVTIGNNVWIGGRAVICPGVTVGDHTVIGAGSVVTRDLPPNVVAAGNPCRVIRPL